MKAPLSACDEHDMVMYASGMTKVRRTMIGEAPSLQIDPVEVRKVKCVCGTTLIHTSAKINSTQEIMEYSGAVSTEFVLRNRLDVEGICLDKYADKIAAAVLSAE